jgi:hypothetical protein
MPLPRFTLADLTASELAAEMLRRLPAHTPEWTDPPPGDPGRTLIELFAWLTETLLYRVNLIPERQRLEFLRLLNIPMRPARPASGLVALAVTDAVPRPVPVPLGSPVTGPLTFETTGPVTVRPVEGRVYVKRRPSDEERAGFGTLIEDLEALYGVRGEPYVTTPLFTDNRAEPAGVDPLAMSVDRTLWLALLAPTAAVLEAARAALEGEPALLNIGVVPPPGPTDPDAPLPDLPDLWRWEASTAPATPGGPPGWLPVETTEDGTAGLARAGTLRLVLPPAGRLRAPPDDVGAAFQAGVGDRPPRLDDPALADRLLGWLRLRGLGGGDALPLAWMGVNAVPVDQRRTVKDVVLAVGDGTAAQAVQLPGGSVEPASLLLEVEEDAGGLVRWQRVDDLAAHAPQARVFELDAEAGMVRFGDGVRGRIPGIGARIVARAMRHGGGSAGNLGPGALTGIAVQGLKVTQPVPLTGAADAETLEEAERRIPAVLRHGGRCVTAADYRDLAFDTPGVDVARVEVLERFRPFQRRFDVPGTVAVMVLPRSTPPRAPNPRPDRNLVERVRAHLDARRPLATELYVIGTEYRPLALSAAFAVRQGFARDAVAKAVREAFLTYLWPLAPGGRDGSGWPLGLAVSNLELEVAMARVAGVGATGGVLLLTPGAGGWVLLPREGAGGAQRLALEPWQLPELAAIRLAVDADSPFETIDEPPPGGTGDEAPVPIPVVPEVC